MNVTVTGLWVLAAEAGGGAAPAGGAAQPANPFGIMIPLILIFIVFIVLQSRAQKKREQKYREMLDSIKPRDEVMTRGGIYGRVVQVKEDAFVLRVDPDKDVKITVAKNGIARKLGEPESGQ